VFARKVLIPLTGLTCIWFDLIIGAADATDVFSNKAQTNILRPQGSCCPQCGGDCLFEGQVHDNGASFSDGGNQCVSCSCMEGSVSCRAKQCPAASCRLVHCVTWLFTWCGRRIVTLLCVLQKPGRGFVQLLRLWRLRFQWRSSA